MSDSESIPVPSADECQRRIDAFVAVSETDDAHAQMLLQDNDWIVEKALIKHFGEVQSTASAASPPTPSAAATPSDSFNTNAPEELIYITFNIDGLAEKNLQIRTKAVAKLIQHRRADVICLQEVIPETYKYLQKKLPEYQFICENPEADYFVAVLLRRFVVYLDSFQTIDFPTSRMGRNLLKVECHIAKFEMTVFTSHLESTKDHADERMRQLEICFKHMKDEAAVRTVMLGGDLNMRDKELAEVGGIPRGMVDAWEHLGKDSTTQYTWDMVRNSNLEFPGRFKPRCRFDRVYVKDSMPAKRATLQHFGLLGIERIRAAQCFPSDHWGIVCALKIKSNEG